VGWVWWRGDMIAGIVTVRKWESCGLDRIRERRGKPGFGVAGRSSSTAGCLLRLECAGYVQASPAQAESPEERGIGAVARVFATTAPTGRNCCAASGSGPFRSPGAIARLASSGPRSTLGLLGSVRPTRQDLVDLSLAA